MYLSKRQSWEPKETGVTIEGAGDGSGRVGILYACNSNKNNHVNYGVYYVIFT